MIPKRIKDARWRVIRRQRVTRCMIHGTRFLESIEPCFACAKEFYVEKPLTSLQLWEKHYGGSI